MSLVKFTKYTVVVTFIALVYIHLQMQIVDLAYQGQAKEVKIKDLADQNGNTFYAISKLKSANHLGGGVVVEGFEDAVCRPRGYYYARRRRNRL